MKKVIIIFSILLVAILVFILMENHNLKKRILEHQEELEVSSGYIDKLTAENKKLKQQKKTEINTKSKLENYLQEKGKNEESLPVGSRELREKLEQYKKREENFPDLIPVKSEYVVSQRFSAKHPALDFAVPLGTEIRAAAAGEVLSVYEDKYFGKVVMIDHLNDFATLYAHLAKILVQTNMSVGKGETIGLAGNTGNSTAPHLHFEILKNGKNIDPAEILKNLK